MSEPSLADARVRQGLYHAVDMHTLVATVFGPDYPSMAGAFDGTTPDFTPQDANLNYDQPRPTVCVWVDAHLR
ncbi:hypothetical protein GCM10023318_25160 [Nocardia callitridis]|uniref:Uncharacterized protein n=2 Tax=Nocardia callitridis TaxID=648753 RepID=A0ABP9K6R0_9NOCA